MQPLRHPNSPPAASSHPAGHIRLVSLRDVPRRKRRRDLRRTLGRTVRTSCAFRLILRGGLRLPSGNLELCPIVICLQHLSVPFSCFLSPIITAVFVRIMSQIWKKCEHRHSLTQISERNQFSPDENSADPPCAFARDRTDRRPMPSPLRLLDRYRPSCGCTVPPQLLSIEMNKSSP